MSIPNTDAVAANAGPSRQFEIYVGGMLAGQKPAVPIDIKELERQAKAKMPPEAWAYIAGGAGIETTVANNRSAFDEWQILPRMLRGVAKRSTQIELFGHHYPSPILLGPVGVQEMVHPEADLATARAAAALRVPYIFSNQASVSMEECVKVMGDSPRWFQLYWGKDDRLVASLARRAEAVGCQAIVVTLDTTTLGWRTRDLDVSYLPFLIGKGIAQYTSDPFFRSLLEKTPEEDIMAASQLFISIYSEPGLTWDRLQFLRQQTQLPILLKGITHPDDARLAVEYGMSGIVVSNHGGRQVDGAISSLEALPECVDAVAGRIPVLFDSGIRGGADVFKALALGAKGILLGRPYAYGLTIAGQQGVEEVLKNFMADFDLTMALSGCRNVGEITRDTIRSTRS
ncbi:lactate 2-monooxygenase [bacterium]|nr:lactate 2-monooxygenase [bacterium]